MMAVKGELLFYPSGRRDRASLADLLRHQQQQGLVSQVDSLSTSDFQSLSDDELLEKVNGQLQIEPLTLLRDEGDGQVTEQNISVQSPFGGLVTVKGLKIVQSVPFKGEADLWHLQPSTFDLNPPHGEIRGSNVVVGIDVREGQQEIAIQHIKGTLDNIERNIERQKAQLVAYNESLAGLIRPAIAARRSTLQSASDLSSKLKGL